jgi:hypothetical protein
MNEKQGNSARDRTPLVHIMDAECAVSIHRNRANELRKSRVDLRLVVSPVISISPPLKQPPQDGQRNSIFPPRTRELVWKARQSELVAKILEASLRDSYTEGAFSHCGGEGGRRGVVIVQAGLNPAKP